MYWITSDDTYLALGVTEKFSCWGAVKLGRFGTFECSSSYLKFDKKGNLLEIMSGPVSTSVQEEFHITEIHFLSNDKLICAHYVNIDLEYDSFTSITKLSNLRKCCERDIPINVLEEVKLFRIDPGDYELRVINKKLKIQNKS